MSQTQFDAIVVGARCAGSTAAYYLSRAGYRVLLVDRTFFPSDVLSTHTLFNNTVDTLRDMGVLDKLLETDTPVVNGCRFQFDDAVIEGNMPLYNGESASYCFRRTYFDQILLDHARAQEGVTALEGFRVTETLEENGTVIGVRGHLRDGDVQEFRAKIVIGADGRVSTIRKQVEAQLKFSTPTDYGTYYGYFANLPAHPHSYLEIYQLGIPRAYIFPTSDGHHIVAACFPLADKDLIQLFKKEPEKTLRDYMTNFMGETNIPERLEKAVLAEPIKGILDFDNHWYQGMGKGWALTGDAICFKDPGMGQGMHDAIFGARILANVLSRYEDWAANWEEMSNAYQQEIESEFMVRFQMCCQITKAVAFPPEEQAKNRAIAANPQATQAFLGLYNYAHEPHEIEAAFHTTNA
ncbi:NAD(P)/FAD-dependent oxidoreductase [Tumebacillus sp. ITR2]|uniref:NAD(P)/FAD-dependent oxidoreductase n=1 Tax=Tumebacillus amylolyticus TaxID=2801339 RepID=A0ABS1J487_9BACL|nr:NAD(P)/FAD-dependent oxidoreductase [Tumebacillus amylolyticus]MBL0385081.1 NAD(P)/FAD-dependent oxidoreductase [Tumebacillus amylolyticus]